MLTKIEHQNEELLKLVRENRVRLLKAQLLVRRLRRRERATAKGILSYSTQGKRVDKFTP